MKYKYVFCDIDGTLTDRFHSLCKENIPIINKARGKGVKFIFCTGRLPFSTVDFAKEIGVYNRSDEFLICDNGAVIVDGTYKVFKSNPIPPKETEAIIDYCIDNDIAIRPFMDGLVLNYNVNSFPNTKVRSTIVGCSKEELLNATRSNPVFKISIGYHDKDGDSIAKDLNEITQGNVECSYLKGIDYMEINVKGETKGNAIKEFCKKMNIDIVQTLGIGDSYNDVEMLKVVGFPACPSNAHEQVKEMCKYVAKRDCGDAAVGEIIEKIVLVDDYD